MLTARPAAFAIFALYRIFWITIGNRLEWHSLATLTTWGMTLVIQRAEHRDTQAIHAKLDELLKATHRAYNELMHIDDKDADQRLRHTARVMVHQQPLATALFEYVRSKRRNVEHVAVRSMRIHLFNTYDPRAVDRYLRIVHHN